MFGRAQEQIAARVGVEGLALEGARRRVVADRAEVVEHVVHLRVEVTGRGIGRLEHEQATGRTGSATGLRSEAG